MKILENKSTIKSNLEINRLKIKMKEGYIKQSDRKKILLLDR